MLTNETCPFDADICKSPTGNLIIQTPILDNYKDLGLNRGPRASIQLKHHCAPLVIDQFTQIREDPEHPGNKFLKFTVGPLGTDYVEVPLNVSSAGNDFNGNYKVRLVTEILFFPARCFTIANHQSAHWWDQEKLTILNSE